MWFLAILACGAGDPSDDSGATTAPSATCAPTEEVCDGVDQDCDGQIDNGLPTSLSWKDEDGDGHGTEGTGVQHCAAPGWVASGDDCNDDDPAINPGASEVCGGGDEDCDDLVDEQDPDLDPAGTTAYYADTDRDGYGDPGSAVVACEAPFGTITDGSDCDDRDPGANPGATEVCGGADEDCDGLADDLDPSVDPATLTRFYADADGDGHGDAAAPSDACIVPAGTAAVADDCDDLDAAVWDGSATWRSDGDGDGYGDPATASAPACHSPAPDLVSSGVGDDCDDGNAAIHPNAADLPLDGVDQDCDGVDRRIYAYVADRYSGVVSRIDATDGTRTDFSTGNGDMIGLAHADDGRTWVARYNTGIVTEIAADGARRDVVSGLTEADGLWWDPATARLLVVDSPAGNVWEVDPVTQARVRLAGGFLAPIHAVRVPGSTDVYVSDRTGPDHLSRIDAAGVVTTAAHLPFAADSIAPADLGGFLYVSGSADSVVAEVELATGHVTMLPIATAVPAGMCRDPFGPEILVDEHDLGVVQVLEDGLVSELAAGVGNPWGCAGDRDADSDGDGLWSARLGGDDCDDTVPGSVVVTLYADADGDGHGDPARTRDGCGPLTGWSLLGDDCDEADPTRYPGAPEACDGLDHDCDGLVDDADPDLDPSAFPTWGLDADLDGFGDPSITAVACGAGPPGYVADTTDCDDGDAAIHPGAAEITGDGVDQDCDGLDSAGTVYVAERYIGQVWAIDRATGAATVAWSGLGELIGLARAPDGRIWVTRFAARTVAELNFDGTFTDIFGGFTAPTALSYDPSTDSLLAVDEGAGAVLELFPSTGRQVLVANGFADPISAVRFPGRPEIWVSQRSAPEVKVIDALGAITVGAVVPGGTDSLVAGDGGATLFASTGSSGEINVIDTATGVVTPYASGLAFPYGMCRDPGGPGVLVSLHDVGDVIVLDPAQSVFSGAPTNPWQCADDLPADSDGDGAWALRIGGDDCDDSDPAVFPGQGCP
jgi:hypothetical protein